MAFADNLAYVRAQISAACAQVGRSPSEVHIIAVTKRHPVTSMLEALAAGCLDLGENRVQEALPKLEALPPEARVHLIGQLQGNKVNKAVGRFASIASVDRVDLLDRIDRRAAELGLVQEIWLQVNATGEPQKGGVPLDAAGDLWSAACDRAHLRLRGVMAMGRAGDDEAATRATFAAVRERAASWPSPGGAVGLSLGMSGDYIWAVLEGATHLRLGTALFGPRPA